MAFKPSNCIFWFCCFLFWSFLSFFVDFGSCSSTAWLPNKSFRWSIPKFGLLKILKSVHFWSCKKQAAIGERQWLCNTKLNLISIWKILIVIKFQFINLVQFTICQRLPKLLLDFIDFTLVYVSLSDCACKLAKIKHISLGKQHLNVWEVLKTVYSPSN